MELPNKEKNRTLGEKETYKYFKRIVIDSLGTLIKGLIQGLHDFEITGVEIIETTVLLRPAKILRRVVET